MALRQLADDVRERFARLRMRHQTTGNDSTKATRRRSKVVTSSPTCDASFTGASDDRTATPDLIRPHVDATAGRTASLPPLPPPPSSVTRPRPRRRSSAYLRPVATVAAMGHIYEEIPPTPPPQNQSGSEVVGAGRVYYVSPLDGALCRICPINDRAVHRRQLSCTHVEHQHQPATDTDGERSSSLIEITDITACGLSAVRGRELRLCTDCCRQLRSALATDETAAVGDCQRRLNGAASPLTSFYNSCDLSLLNVPCYYWSEGAGDVTRTDTLPSSDADTQTVTTEAARDSVCDDAVNNVKDNVIRSDSSSSEIIPIKPAFGQSGSAFTKLGVRRNSTDDRLLVASTHVDDSSRTSRHRQRPDKGRLSGGPSFDERRRPLRHADDSLLAVLDSVRHGDCRSRYLHLCDETSGLPSDVIDRLPGQRGSCVKSTSCADFWSPRRRSLAVRRRSEDVGRRRRLFAASCRGADGGSMTGSASESSLGRSEVKSVYYNGLLASMIDLTAAYDRASVDDRLSCRATSGPRGSLRTSSQLSTFGGHQQRHSDCFSSAVHRSSGDLMLRSVQ